MTHGNGVLIYRIGILSGLGHALVSVLNAAAAARAMRRRFALDARDFQYFAADRHVQFHACFSIQAPPDLEMVTDFDEITRLLAHPSRRHLLDDRQLTEAAAAPEHVLTVFDAPLREQYTLSGKALPPDFRVLPQGWLLDRMAPALAAFAADPPIGLYFRHGNGEFLHGRLDRVVFSGYEARLAALQKTYAQLARSLAKSADAAAPRYFIASDNADFVAKMQQLLPGGFSLAAELPDQDYKVHLAKHGHSPDILFEAARDLWALSACRALVYSKSLFASFAALNSATLAAAEVCDVGAPFLDRMLHELPIEQALPQAWAAYEAQPQEMADFLLETLVRAGDEAGAALLRQRIGWWRNGMQRHAGIKDARRMHRAGRRLDAIAQVRQLDAAEPANPYRLHLLAAWLLAEGDAPAAETALRRAAAMDGGIKAVNELLAKVMA